MDFELNEDQKEFQNVMRDFVNKEINPVAMEMEKSGEYPEKIVQGLKDLGLFGMTVPEEYGGLDLDPVSFAIVFEPRTVASAVAGLEESLGTSSKPSIPPYDA